METHIFIDNEKAFDSVQEQICDISDTLLQTVVDIHTQNKILVKLNSILLKLAKINTGVCQNCPLSPSLFNIYLDEIVTIGQKEDKTVIPLSESQQLLTLLCADEQVIISNTDDRLQISAHKLN